MKKEKNICVLKVPTKWGTFYLEASSKGLTALRFPGEKGFKVKKGTGSGILPASPAGRPVPFFRKAARRLKDYFSGKSVSFSDIPIDDSHWTAFERKVLRVLAQVKCGSGVSYQSLARKAGSPKASRAVGSVMAKNTLPIILPCHRVLQSGGGLGGFSKGLSVKKRLLALEGIPYKKGEGKKRGGR